MALTTGKLAEWSRHISVAHCVCGNSQGPFEIAAAQVGGVHQPRPGAIQFGHEGIGPSSVSRLDSMRGGEIVRFGHPRYVSVAERVDSNAQAKVEVAAAEVGGV